MSRSLTSASARKPTVPRLTPSTGTSSRSAIWTAGEHRAVPSDRDHQVESLQTEPHRCRVLRRPPDRRPPRYPAPVHPPPSSVRCLGRLSARHEGPAPSSRCRLTLLSTVSIRRGASEAGPGRAMRKNSLLPRSPRNGEAVTATAPRPAASRHPTTLRTACPQSSPSAHHAILAQSSPVQLELRLDQQHELGFRSAQRGQNRGDHTERDEGEVGDDQIERSTEQRQGQRGGGWSGRAPPPLGRMPVAVPVGRGRRRAPLPARRRAAAGNR